MRLAYNLLYATILIGGTVAAWLLPGLGRDDELRAAAPSPALLRRETIAFYERRLDEDPHSALDMAQLAALSLDEGRMTGDERAFARAESLALRSLGERARRNGHSAVVLASALLAQHRFGDAVTVARQLVEAEPEQPAYRALLAEAEMETGDYDDAARQLTAARSGRDDLGIAPRFARWAELTGRTGDARRILQRTRAAADHRDDLTGEQRAWFSLRLADFELRYGNLRNAEGAIRHGLAQAPGDWRLVLTRARLEAARRRWRDVIASAEDVLASIAAPDALALMATAHRHLGDLDDADAFERALEQVALSGRGTPHRSWIVAMLDDGSRDERLLALAAADTLVRQDVHTLDLLAWALYRSGRAAEAIPVMHRAMALGTTEPSLHYHAAVIEWAAGDVAEGERHRRFALGRSRALTAAQVRELRQGPRR